MALFDTSPSLKFSKLNNFLWACWFLGKNLSNFVSPLWKLNNPYCHSEYLLKYGSCKKLLLSECNSDQLNISWPFLSSLLGGCNSKATPNPSKSDDKNGQEMFNWSKLHSERSNFFKKSILFHTVWSVASFLGTLVINVWEFFFWQLILFWLEPWLLNVSKIK